ncbi:type VI secretion system, tssF domain-containing protein [Ditylenchus destructor]|nr:type VI secretion system, tssF domain-containing protein [Ditylenchus destructor]
MQEAAAMPRRFLFLEVTGLAERLARIDGTEAEIVLFFSRGDAALEALVDADSVALHCTPAINLFPKRLDRIQLGTGSWEYHVVPDRTRPMDYEVHSLQSVDRLRRRQSRPADLLAAVRDLSRGPAEAPGFYTARREPRLLSLTAEGPGAAQRLHRRGGVLSLVDPRHAPYREDIRQLSVSALVTNRDLPMLLPHNGAGTWRLDAAGPVLKVEAMHGPTRTASRQPAGEAGWNLVGLLTQQQLPWADEPPAQAAATLRRMLALYGPPGDAAWLRQVEGVRGVSAKPVVRRLPFTGPLSYGAGTEIELELDELHFQGHSAFLFASVLERYFTRYAAINSFSS